MTRTAPRSTLRALGVTIMACLALAAGAIAGPVAAQDYPPDAEGVQIDRDSVRPGGTVLVNAAGFCPNSNVDVWLVSRGSSGPRASRRGRRIKRVRASSTGRVRSRVRIPRRTRPGSYQLELVGSASDCRSSRRVSTPLEVAGQNDSTQPSGVEAGPDDGAGGNDPSVGGLPFTGLQLSLLAAVGTALLAAGVVLRRRLYG